MSELNRIAKMLDAAFVPREVWIGNDSTADRVEWLIKRNENLKEKASSRFDTFSDEFMILLTAQDDWETVADISKRLGIESDKLKPALCYLASKGLVAEINDGLRGNLYSKL